jgi:hypothetical protein
MYRSISYGENYTEIDEALCSHWDFISW